MLQALVLTALVSAQDWADMTKQAKFSLSESIDKGLKEGIPFHAELELDNGVVVYSIDLAQGENTCNVVMSAADGKVIENDVEKEDHQAEIRACKVTLKAAIAAALKKSPGTAVEAELTLESDKPVITVGVFADGKLSIVKVDGASGEALSSETPRVRKEPAFTETFRVDKSEWASTGANPYFSLEPGTFLILEGKEGDEEIKLTITVLNETKVVDGVETRIVEEREEEGGELIEVSRNFFAISKKTNSVYYFGEEVDMYKDGKVINHNGAWESGKDGARFGLMMPGTPMLGARYYQEIAPGVAMDRAVISSLTGTLETPAGKFENCLVSEESTPLEPGRESKIYAPGIGLIQDASLKLTKHGRNK